MLSPTHSELLTPIGMAHAREAVIARNSWFLHVSGEHCFNGLKQSGILPHNPGKAIETDLAEAIGDNSGCIVCLRPIFTLDTTPKREHDQIVLAISNSDLPLRVGIDWSYDGCWGLVDVLAHEAPHSISSNIFSEVVRRTGCVVSYDPVPLDVIRVWTTGTPQIDPAKWPLLSQTPIANVRILK